MRGASVISYFLAGAIPRLAMFVILFLLARWLTIEETGLFVLVMTVGEILEMISANWLRLFAQSREAGQSRLRPLRLGRLAVMGVAMYGLAAASVLPAAIIVAPGRVWDFTLATLVYVTAFALLRLVLVIQQITHNHALFSHIELVRGVLVLVSVVAAARLPGATFFGPALALGLSSLVVAVVGLVASRAQVSRPRIVWKGFGTARRFGAPIIADTILSFVIIYFERFVLNEMLGPASVGVYAIAYALGRQPVDFIAGPMNNLTVPTLFAVRLREGDEAARTMQSGFSITLFILCAGAFTGTLLLRQPIAALFVKPELQADTARLVPMIALAACLVVFKTFLYDNLFFMLGRNGLKLRSIVPAAVGGAVASIGLVAAFGLTGAALAAVAATAMALCASIIATRTFFRFPLPLARFGGIAVAAGLSGLALWGATSAVAAFGPLAELLAGFVAFCLTYAAGLTVQGISVRRILSTPWAPLTPAPPSA